MENFDPKNRRTFEIGVKFEQDEIQDIWKNYCGGAVVATEEKSIDDALFRLGLTTSSDASAGRRHLLSMLRVVHGPVRRSC